MKMTVLSKGNRRKLIAFAENSMSKNLENFTQNLPIAYTC